MSMNTEEIAQAFKALGDENRLKMVQMIAAANDICACHLLDEFDFSQPTLSHHIKILCTAGLIDCRREGKWMHYSLNANHISEIRDLLSTWLDEAMIEGKGQFSSKCCQ